MFDLIIIAIDPATSLESRRFVAEYRSLAICEAAGRTEVQRVQPAISEAVVRPWRVTFTCKPRNTTRTDQQLVLFIHQNGTETIVRPPVLYPTAQACTAAGMAARAQHKIPGGLMSFRCDPVKRGEVQT